MSKIIPFLKPTIGEEEIALCVESLKSGWLAYGEYTHQAESLLQAFFKSDNFLLTSSCTASLQMSLLLADVKPGDEVITTPLTWVATSNVILYTGAKVVFVDVDPETGLLDIHDIQRKITNKTKAIIAVDLYGMMVDYDQLRSAIGSKSISIIEDAAHSFGSELNGKLPGAVADYTCFSFHAAKNITSGQGGGLICRRILDAQKAKLMRRDGVTGRNQERKMIELGFKFDSTDFQSALLIPQIKNYSVLSKLRRSVYMNYLDLFKDMTEVRFQKLGVDHTHSGHMFVLWLSDASKRASLIDFLKRSGVECSVHYNCVHLEPYYQATFGFGVGQYPNAEKIGFSAVSLPTYPSLDISEQRYIYDKVAEFFN